MSQPVEPEFFGLLHRAQGNESGERDVREGISNWLPLLLP